MSIDSANNYYGSTNPAGGATDPWSSYGQYNNRSSIDSDMAGYEQQLMSYIQNLRMSMANLQQGTPAYAQAVQYMNMAMSYLQQIDPQMAMDPTLGGTGWDPNGGMGYGNPYGAPTDPSMDPNNPQSNLPFPVSYQDNTHIVTDEGPSTNIQLGANDTETRTVDIYQKDNTVVVPSNAANVTITAQPDDAVPGKTMIVLTYTCNGKTQTLKYHNVERDGFGLNLQIPDLTQATLDPSLGALASKVNVTELGSASSVQAGDPPTKMDGGTRVYDGQSFNISPVADGTDKKTTVMASGDVTLTPNSNSEYYTMEYEAGPPAEYVVKVYNSLEDKTAGKVKETITIDAALVDHINFAGDPSRIEFLGKLGDSQDPHTINTSDENASKLGFTGDNSSVGAGQALNPDYPEDMIPDELDGTTATYNSSQGGDIHANFDDKYTEHDITAPGKVTIHGTSYADTMKVEYDEDTKTWTVYVYKDGKKDAAHTEKFVIHGGPDTEVALDVMGENSVSGTDAAKASVGLGTDEKSTSSEQADKIINDLETATGASDDDFVSALKKAGFSYKSMDEVRDAINKGEFPKFPPNGKILHFLYLLDKGTLPDLTSAQLDSQNTPNGDVIGALEPVLKRYCDLLGKLYPDHEIRVGQQKGATSYITMDGKTYELNNSTYDEHTQTVTEDWNMVQYDSNGKGSYVE
ncbi:MAG: hypothetical protein U1F57_04060 [bacterium]